MTFRVETSTENDGRWIAEIGELPGCFAYGDTEAEAVASVEALALRVLADRVEHGEPVPVMDNVFTVVEAA